MITKDGLRKKLLHETTLMWFFGKTENYHKDACKYYFAEKMCFRFNLTDCGDRKMSNDFGYVNFHYGVNACVDRRVVAYGACEAIRWWIKDGGRDCRLTKGQKNGCYGQVERRDQESALTCWGLEQ